MTIRYKRPTSSNRFAYFSLQFLGYVLAPQLKDQAKESARFLHTLSQLLRKSMNRIALDGTESMEKMQEWKKLVKVCLKIPRLTAGRLIKAFRNDKALSLSGHNELFPRLRDCSRSQAGPQRHCNGRTNAEYFQINP